MRSYTANFAVLHAATTLLRKKRSYGTWIRVRRLFKRRRWITCVSSNCFSGGRMPEMCLIFSHSQKKWKTFIFLDLQSSKALILVDSNNGFDSVIRRPSEETGTIEIWISACMIAIIGPALLEHELTHNVVGRSCSLFSARRSFYRCSMCTSHFNVFFFPASLDL